MINPHWIYICLQNGCTAVLNVAFYGFSDHTTFNDRILSGASFENVRYKMSTNSPPGIAIQMSWELHTMMQGM